MASCVQKTWEDVQHGTFTKLINSYLRKRNVAIENLKDDLSDGVKLIQFLEIISNKTFPKYEKNPKIRIQKIGNLQAALKFIQDQGIRIVNISAEDICDANLKLILGLIWTIIQKFQIDQISEDGLSAKEGLLLWCQKKTNGYRDVGVKDFHLSWQDGLALCALIHSHRSYLIDFDSLNKEDKAKNLQLAFDVAETALDIPKLLEVEDMVDIKPDERSVMTYISQFYHVFSKYGQVEVAGRRLGKFADLNAQTEAMKDEYGNRARGLADWMDDSINKLNDRDFGNSLADIQTKLDNQNKFKFEEKPPKAVEKSDVEALFNNLTLKLKNNNRPAFTAPEGLSVEDLNKKWDHLNDAELDREAALRDELARQEKLAGIRRRFDDKAGRLEAWLAEKEKYLATDEPVHSINEAQSKLKNHDAFDEEYTKSRPRVDALHQLAEEIAQLKGADASDFTNRANDVDNRWKSLSQPQTTKRDDLNKKLAHQQMMDELRLDWAKQTKEYNGWNKETQNAVGNTYFGDNLEAVEAFNDDLNRSDANIQTAADEKKHNLDNLWNKMQEFGITENNYTPITNKDIEAKHNDLMEELSKRRAAYQSELDRQRHMEDKRKEWAVKAQEFVDSLNNRKNEIASLSGEPDELIAAVHNKYDSGKPENERLGVLTALQEEMAALGIRDNKHSVFTLPTLQLQNQKLNNYIRNLVALLQDEKELKEEFFNRVKAVIAWADQTTPTIKEFAFDNTLAGARNQRQEWNKYKTTIKAPKDVEKLNIEALFAKINQLLANGNRPNFNPTEDGSNLASIDKSWAALNAEENAREEAVNNELRRQEKVYSLVKRFNSDAEDLESWASEHEPHLKNQEPIDSLDTARLRAKFLAVFLNDLEAQNQPIETLKHLRDDIAKLNYKDVDSINHRVEKIDAAYNELRNLAQAKESAIKGSQDVEQEKENLRQEFAEKAKAFNRFVRDTNESINDHNFGYTLESVQAHRAELEKEDEAIKASASAKKTELDNLNTTMQSKHIQDNKHTNFSLNDISNLESQLNENINKRHVAYEAELKRQTENDAKRQNYAAKAQEFVDWIESQKESLGTLEGTPDERIHSTNNIHNNGENGKNKLAEISVIDHEMKAAGIFDNRYTPYTLPVLQTRNTQFDTSVRNFVSDLNEEKELNDREAAQQAEFAQKLAIQNKRVALSLAIQEISVFVENCYEVLTDSIECDSVEAVTALFKALEDVVHSVESQKDKYNSALSTAAELNESSEQITIRWNKLHQDIDTRRESLNKEHEKQQNNEKLRVEFAQSANEFNNYVNSTTAKINGLQGDLEAQLNELVHIKQEIVGGAAKLGEIDTLTQRINAAFITNNKHTNVTFPQLKAAYQQLNKVADVKEDVLQNEIIANKAKGLSTEQLNEYREMFQHFDKDKNAKLSHLELKSCLSSLGEDLQDSEIDKIYNTFGSAEGVTFEAFCDFMSKRAADTDSKDQILESFKLIAGGKDFVKEEDLRRCLPADKVASLLKNMPLYNSEAGCYDYRAYAEKSFVH
eukprot:TRINITY_DN1760_c0_g1_i1.p1 TRINITY_DN1760_c0_g1~~TRINITY_DN1760_c0_g1_i1.p1  ORF type:complete len:1545 (+),score=896.95 TRINITY_DN1760_c0_g1_i1:60-4637(+)